MIILVDSWYESGHKCTERRAVRSLVTLMWQRVVLIITLTIPFPSIISPIAASLSVWFSLSHGRRGTVSHHCPRATKHTSVRENKAGQSGRPSLCLPYCIHSLLFLPALDSFAVASRLYLSSNSNSWPHNHKISH